MRAGPDRLTWGGDHTLFGVGNSGRDPIFDTGCTLSMPIILSPAFSRAIYQMAHRSLLPGNDPRAGLRHRRHPRGCERCAGRPSRLALGRHLAS
jgi:hypothetical protein